jgi:aryl-alcohol dehydrogenase-like predicted oxidoreductase
MGPEVSAIGLSCMSLSGLYGTSDDAAAIPFLRRTIDLGVDFLDCRIIYLVVGFSSLTWVKNF